MISLKSAPSAGAESARNLLAVVKNIAKHLRTAIPSRHRWQSHHAYVDARALFIRSLPSLVMGLPVERRRSEKRNQTGAQLCELSESAALRRGTDKCDGTGSTRSCTRQTAVASEKFYCTPEETALAVIEQGDAKRSEEVKKQLEARGRAGLAQVIGCLKRICARAALNEEG